MSSQPPRFGFAALVGRPNVGKSTLLNRLVGERVSIVTHKPQTTRQRITGVLTGERGQVAFVDTPGIHSKASHALNRYMNRVAKEVFREVDVVLVLLDAAKITGDDEKVLALVDQSSVPALLVFNKIDRLDDRSRLLELTETLTRDRSFAGVFYVSATGGDGVADLEQAVFEHLPEGIPMYDPEEYTDRPLRFLIAELVREQLMLNLHQEIPYGLTVEVEKYEEQKRRTEIHCAIRVATDRHKGMVIGQGGTVLKRVGTKARLGIRELLGRPVHLELWVRVDPDWMDREPSLKRLGFSD